MCNADDADNSLNWEEIQISSCKRAANKLYVACMKLNIKYHLFLTKVYFGGNAACIDNCCLFSMYSIV